MPEKTLLAFDDHGQVGSSLPRSSGDAEQVQNFQRREWI
jgi:hypothetical protein